MASGGIGAIVARARFRDVSAACHDPVTRVARRVNTSFRAVDTRGRPEFTLRPSSFSAGKPGARAALVYSPRGRDGRLDLTVPGETSSLAHRCTRTGGGHRSQEGRARTALDRPPR